MTLEKETSRILTTGTFRYYSTGQKRSKTTEIYHYLYDKNGSLLQREWEKFTKTVPDKPKTAGRVGIYGSKFNQNTVILEMRGYNGFGELITLYRDTLQTNYEYRPDGLRHKKLFHDGSTTHLWDGQHTVAEYGANGTVFARYLRGHGLIDREQSSQLQYYLLNAHGDVVERTSDNGTTLKNYSYDAFGVEESPE